MRWTDKLGGRKFIMGVIAVVLVTFAIDVSGEIKLAFISSVAGGYYAVNSAQKKQGKDAE